MKPFICIALSLLIAAPLEAAKKTTVQELTDTLASMSKERKSDEEIATRLKEIELDEELSHAAEESLAPYLPGPLAQEQIHILEGRSSMLPPPSSEIPPSAAPDGNAQKAILTRAVEYVNASFMQNPHLTALKSTSRYQDGVEGIRTNSGATNNIPNIGHSWDLPNMFMRFIGSHSDSIETDKGVELQHVEKSKVPWGINGQVSEGGPSPSLREILKEAGDSGKIGWLRWQTIGGKNFAVFSFSVDKKKSQYLVHYCCFPVTQDAGRMGYEGTGVNFQTGTDWKDFKSTVPYRGEIFVDPDTGAIIRLITQAGLKPTDFVHQEDIRVDFAPVVVAGKTFVLPARSFTLTEVVPNGDNYAARYSIRHTLFTSTYQNYQPAGSGAASN